MLAATLTLAACGTAGTDGGQDGQTTTDTSTESPLSVYRVAPGDSLSRIAREHCGDEGAVVSIFEANQGRLQADGKALVDLDLIVVGWDLVIDCSAAGALEAFTPAPEPSSPLPTRNTAFPRQQVPEHDLVLPARAEPPDQGEPCPGTSTLPVIKPFPLRAGAAASGRSLAYGDRLLLAPEGFAASTSAELVDSAGRRLEIPPAGPHFELYADPSIPRGHYAVEIRGGDATAQGAVDLVAAENLALVRRGPRAYDIVGGSSSIAFAVYRWTPGSCGEGAQPRLETGPLPLADGLGRVSIDAQATAGTYCLTVVGEDPLFRCGPTRQFVIP